ncbi:MAG TPA: beta-propeller fold lactonase family protein, partial [Terriglobales bacterium]
DFLYVANSGSNNISAFLVCDKPSTTCPSPDGTLTPVSGSPFAAGLGPASVAITPSGDFLYVANRQSNQISGFTMNASTGALTAQSPATTSTGANPVCVAVSPDEQHLYAANTGAASISGFAVTESSGLLTPTEAPVTTGAQPSAIVMK